MDLNKTIIVGRLTKDIELSYTQGGMSYTNFSIANNYKYKDEKKVNFIDCVAWSKTAELMNQYLKKGSMVAIDGRLQQDTWEKDGQKRSKLKVIVDSIQFLGGKDD